MGKTVRSYEDRDYFDNVDPRERKNKKIERRVNRALKAKRVNGIDEPRDPKSSKY